MAETQHNNWFSKCMPRIKDVSRHLPIILKGIRDIDGVRDLFVWGSYASNIDNPDFRLRNIDIIARTRFYSDDFLSIDKKIIKESMTEEDLENLGYDPQCIVFSKEFTKPCKYNLNHWVISSDKKLLHWGPISECRQDDKNLKEEAHQYASKETGVSFKKINSVSEKHRTNWYQCVCKYINSHIDNMPSGWYKVEDIVIKDILKKAIKL